MRTITAIMIILFIMTQGGAREIGSSVSKIRQKRSWVVDIITMKRGHQGFLGFLKFYVNTEECEIYGPGINDNPKDLFVINKSTKEISVTGNVDYGDRKNFTLVFECAALKDVYERLAVDILIEEVYEPYFSKGIYVISVEESMLQGTNLLTLHAPNRTIQEILTFDVKVTSNPHDVMFFINEKRELSFRGCLDYEENKKYTVVVEAKDQKNVNPHSSTATVIINVTDKNDQRPVITSKTGTGRVKEGSIGTEVYRIQVHDKDSPGSPAWRANFTLRGEKAENFKIEVNPKTNDGILSVIKPLDYEETQKLNLTAEVENDEPFFSCSVRKMHYDGKEWEVDYSRNGSSASMFSFLIIIDDVNEPPVFTDIIKFITVMENTPPGHSLWTFTVRDQDQNPPNTHRFIKGKDIDNWVTIDSRTGKVSTAKVLDRESLFVKNSTYTVILLAVDDGTPPQTGTGTLIIQLLDENDNAPVLKDNEVTICLPQSMTNITAVDPDLPPFTKPFIYEILENKRKWRLEPPHGETVNLVKDSSVYSGSYELILNISDSGGLSSRQKLSVTVRNCSAHSRSDTIRTRVPGIFITFICLLLMLCVLLMVLKCSWCSYTAEKKPFPEFEESKSVVFRYNDEGPGSDVEMELQKKFTLPPYNKLDIIAKKKKMKEHNRHDWKILQKQDWNKTCTVSDVSQFQMWKMLNTVIEEKLLRLHEEEKELCDYKPHQYDNEGEPEDLAQLDSISMADSYFSLGDLQNLVSKFQRLAAKCRPDYIQESTMSQASLSSQQ
ncbi:cadherin-13 isoform X1 [Pangasianodon hypophthalmus]|uniref:cadherin-13 isoform X1 n=1 Tax=Pangasianodon hypophthalmus TaxID=310915 RepID=UPI0023072AC1|nr:cadherin-13 isoform X1 [Pangasianodon hypophthalmus]